MSIPPCIYRCLSRDHAAEGESSSRPSGAAGFTIIEVLIAILMVAVLATGVSLATLGASHVHEATSLKQKEVDVAEAVYERLQSDRSWAKTCPPTHASVGGSRPVSGGDCSLTRFRASLGSTLTDGDLHVTFKIQKLTVQGVDDPADGLGAADSDGSLPDYYHVNLVVGLDSHAQARVGRLAPVTIASTIQNGGTQSHTGSLVVSFCAVQNQIDQRMATVGCDSGSGVATRMAACPQGVSCAAFLAASASGVPSSFSSVVEQPVLPSCTIHGPSGYARTCGGSVNRWPVDASQRQTGYLFTNIPAGMYTVNFSSPSGFTPWTSHFIPADGATPSSLRVSVEENQRDRALITFQPAGPGATLVFHYLHRNSKSSWHGVANSKLLPIEPYCHDPFTDKDEEYDNALGVGTGGTGSIGGFAIRERCEYTSDLGHPVGHTTETSTRHLGPDDQFAYESESWYQVKYTVYMLEYGSTVQLPGGTAGYSGAAVEVAKRTVAAAPYGRVQNAAKTKVPVLDTPPVPPNSELGNQGDSTSSFSDQLPYGLNAPPSKVDSDVGNVRISPRDPSTCSFIWVTTSQRALCNGNASAPVNDTTYVGQGDCYATMSGTPFNYTIRSTGTAPGCDQHCMFYPPNSRDCCGTGYLVYKVTTQETTYMRDRFAEGNPIIPVPAPWTNYSPEVKPVEVMSSPTATHPTTHGISACGPAKPIVLTWSAYKPDRGSPKGGGPTGDGSRTGSTTFGGA